MQRPGPLQQRTSSWATEQTNGASCPRISLPQAMGSWPLAQPSFYQYKRTEGPAEPLRGNGSTQSSAMRWRLSTQIDNRSRFSPECPTGRAAARGNLGQHPSPIDADEGPATAGAGELPCPPPTHRPRSGGRRRLSNVSHGSAVASSGRPPLTGAGRQRSQVAPARQP